MKFDIAAVHNIYLDEKKPKTHLDFNGFELRDDKVVPVRVIINISGYIAMSGVETDEKRRDWKKIFFYDAQGNKLTLAWDNKGEASGRIDHWTYMLDTHHFRCPPLYEVIKKEWTDRLEKIFGGGR